MRIFHICDVANQSNGIYSVLIPLSHAQKNLGNDVYVFNVRKSGIDNQLCKLVSTKELFNEITTKRPDIVIFHGIFYWQIIPTTKLLLSNKIPYLIELHGAMSTLNMQKSWLKKRIAKFLFIDKIIRHANAIIYLNTQEYCNSTIRDLNSKCVIIPNGTECVANNSTHYNSDVINLIYLGRIDRNHKGLDILISALKILNDNQLSNHIHCSFYGRGSKYEMNWLKSEIEKLGAIANFNGPVYGEDKEKAYQKANIFILTSRYEGFPMSILESLSYGVPCIITPMTNVSDIILKHDCGWIALLDPINIAQTILYAAKDYNNRKEILSQNSINAIKKYNWGDIAKQSISAYSNILNNDFLSSIQILTSN